MTEILRRIHLEIFDPIEYDKALNWIKENCREGIDINAGKDLPDIVKNQKLFQRIRIGSLLQNKLLLFEIFYMVMKS